MGQGTESCGGYDVEYDEYEEYREGLDRGMWVCKDGTSIHVDRMTTQHLKNARRVAAIAARRAAFTSQIEIWENWIDVFDNEIARRECQSTKAPNATSVIKKVAKPKQAPRGKMVTMICFCGREYEAREADVRRGWGLTCCKSHAAIRREYGRPAAKRKQS